MAVWTASRLSYTQQAVASEATGLQPQGRMQRGQRHEGLSLGGQSQFLALCPPSGGAAAWLPAPPPPQRPLCHSDCQGESPSLRYLQDLITNGEVL